MEYPCRLCGLRWDCDSICDKWKEYFDGLCNMSNVDDKINQCNADIKKLQDELVKLEEQKRQDSRTFRYGQRFTYNGVYSGSEVTLCQVLAYTYCLIGKSGNREADAVRFDHHDLTWDDLQKLIYEKTDVRNRLTPIN